MSEIMGYALAILAKIPTIVTNLETVASKVEKDSNLKQRLTDSLKGAAEVLGEVASSL